MTVTHILDRRFVLEVFVQGWLACRYWQVKLFTSQPGYERGRRAWGPSSDTKGPHRMPQRPPTFLIVLQAGDQAVRPGPLGCIPDLNCSTDLTWNCQTLPKHSHSHRGCLSGPVSHSCPYYCSCHSFHCVALVVVWWLVDVKVASVLTPAFLPLVPSGVEHLLVCFCLSISSLGKCQFRSLVQFWTGLLITPPPTFSVNILCTFWMKVLKSDLLWWIFYPRFYVLNNITGWVEYFILMKYYLFKVFFFIFRNCLPEMVQCLRELDA